MQLVAAAALAISNFPTAQEVKQRTELAAIDELFEIAATAILDI